MEKAIDENNIYTNNNVVSVVDKPIVINYRGIYQRDLNNKLVPRLRLNLTENQLLVLKILYFNKEPLGQLDIWAKLNNCHPNTVINALKLLKLNGLIKRYIGGFIGSKAHSYADTRYKFYVLTPEGEEEFENQIKTRPVK